MYVSLNIRFEVYFLYDRHNNYIWSSHLSVLSMYTLMLKYMYYIFRHALLNLFFFVIKILNWNVDIQFLRVFLYFLLALYTIYVLFPSVRKKNNIVIVDWLGLYAISAILNYLVSFLDDGCSEEIFILLIKT